MKTTRTINPLPFQDLEPKRFEDLVRQLIYDFKIWSRLEATGRSGSDDGFDVRGIEGINIPDELITEELDVDVTSRIWLIQCKREKIISPSKLLSHLKDIKLPKEQVLHGMIFAAACDFSKKTRDIYHQWCRDNGITESIIWGKGELEDMLFQQKNDNLLFAYFGISLSIRKKSLSSKLRYRIAIKKKIKSCLSIGRDLVVRDPNSDDYPISSDKEKQPSWFLCEYMCLGVKSLIVELKNCLACVDDETLKWDAADKACRTPYNHSVARVLGDDDYQLISQSQKELDDVTDYRKTDLSIIYKIPYEDILAIDDTCEDSFYDGVQIYTDLSSFKNNIDDEDIILLCRDIQGEYMNLEKGNRVRIFSDNIRTE